MPSKILVANWKMNGSLASCFRYVEVLESRLHPQHSYENIIFCPPSPYLLPLQGRLVERGFALGAQDCARHTAGAYTGDVGAAMLKDVGATYTLIGHSERRQGAQETNAHCLEKMQQAHQAGLTAIYCVGETQEERAKGALEAVLTTQLQEGLSPSAETANTLIAYEPVWAIGTGQTPTLADIQKSHELIQGILAKRPGHKATKILYGGSVKKDNLADILTIPVVAGALIGGASLDPQTMAEMITIAQNTQPV